MIALVSCSLSWAACDKEGRIIITLILYIKSIANALGKDGSIATLGGVEMVAVLLIVK